MRFSVRVPKRVPLRVTTGGSVRVPARVLRKVPESCFEISVLFKMSHFQYPVSYESLSEPKLSNSNSAPPTLVIGLTSPCFTSSAL